jgi:predicted CoA-binding protein
MATFTNPSDDAIRELLLRVRRIAVVGLSPKPHRDSNRVARYLQQAGYEVVPVYPREDTILGQRVYRNVREIEEPIDLVDVFRRSEALGPVFDDAQAAQAPAIWLQLDCIDEERALLAQARGVTVVLDRCIMVDHARLVGRRS